MKKETKTSLIEQVRGVKLSAVTADQRVQLLLLSAYDELSAPAFPAGIAPVEDSLAGRVLQVAKQGIPEARSAEQVAEDITTLPYRIVQEREQRDKILFPDTVFGKAARQLMERAHSWYLSLGVSTEVQHDEWQTNAVDSYTFRFLPNQTSHQESKLERSREDIEREITELTMHLVRYKTITDGQDSYGETMRLYGFLIARVQEFSQETGRALFVRILNVHIGDKDRLALMIAPSEEALQRQRVLFMGHTDVVHGDDEQFNPEQINHNSRLYIKGRGALDMKGPVGVEVLWAKHMPEDFGVLLTSDEEVGGLTQKVLAENEIVVPEAIFDPDGASSKKLASGAKGILRVGVSAETPEAAGKSRHAAYVQSGDNASDFLDRFAAFISLRYRAGGWLRGKGITRNKVSADEGTPSVGQVPTKARVLYDFRFPRQAQGERVLRVLQRWIKVANFIERWTHPGKPKDQHRKLHLETILERPPQNFDPSSPFIRTFASAWKKVTGEVLGVHREPGGNDTYYYWLKDRELPVVLIQAEGEGKHGDEIAALDWLVNLYSVGLEWFSALASTPGAGLRRGVNR